MTYLHSPTSSISSDTNFNSSSPEYYSSPSSLSSPMTYYGLASSPNSRLTSSLQSAFPEPYSTTQSMDHFNNNGYRTAAFQQDPSSGVYNHPNFGAPHSNHRSHRSSSSSSGGNHQYVCMEPGCEYISNRHYDLKRHAAAKHKSKQQHYEDGRTTDCPYGGCGCKGIHGFLRIDHLRDHCRRYHRRELPKSLGGTGKIYVQPEKDSKKH